MKRKLERNYQKLATLVENSDINNESKKQQNRVLKIFFCWIHYYREKKLKFFVIVYVSLLPCFVGFIVDFIVALTNSTMDTLFLRSTKLSAKLVE